MNNNYLYNMVVSIFYNFSLLWILFANDIDVLCMCSGHETETSVMLILCLVR